MYRVLDLMLMIFLVDLFYYFDHSTKRKAELAGIYNYILLICAKLY